MLGDSTTIPAQTPDEISLPRAPRRTVPPSLASRYDDVTFVGEGGMGSVYRGRDPRLGRTVALKLIKSDDPKLWLRFIQEAKSQARIQHACVCPVYEAGQADGEPYIAMQYIDGEPLSRLKDKLTREQRIRLVIDVAMAVHEAHRLGLIHRDIKPGNILVETQDDGSLKPYIMDFGLARQVEEKGQTMTGAIVGTIAYMPPEQANGDIRAMDRRSDVYSLGATLYDILAGRPPFVAETHWKLILMVGSDEAPRLSAVKPEIPVDLETIVMKCLERSPSRRYESAKALAEDLQRFLDGDAIYAKRSSWTYVLMKKARKHKLLVSLALIAFMASAVPLGAWIHSRKQMAVQMDLSRTLGEDVKSMELYLRAAYAMPLHDVEKERDVVRVRFGEIEKRMISAGKAGEGPGHYAIGRGHLALGEIEKARVHLEQAQAAGYATPELHYALGRVLGELYRQGLEESKRIPEGERRKAKLLELESQLRDPALGHLRAAYTSTESPAYVEGLIAFYEGKHDEALAKARQAFAESSMMYEAKKLEADVLYAQGSKYRRDAAFDYDKMMTYFDPAAEGYAAAANIGRSDPDMHRAECELWTQIMMATGAKAKNARPYFEKGEMACQRAEQASSREGASKIRRAFLHMMFAGSLVDYGSDPDLDRGPIIATALSIAEDALRESPDDVMARYVYAAILATKGRWQANATESIPTYKLAIEAYESTQRLEPRFLWAVRELGDVYCKIGIWERYMGLDGTASFVKAIEKFDVALQIDPDFALTCMSKADAEQSLADQLYNKAQSPQSWLDQSNADLERCKKLGSIERLVTLKLSQNYATAASYAIDIGSDPRVFLDQAAHWARETIRLEPLHSGGYYAMSAQALLEAQYAITQDNDPTAAVNKARTAYDHVRTIGNLDARSYAAKELIFVEIQGIRWAMKQHKATAAIFDNTFAIMKPHLGAGCAKVNACTYMARLYALRARWLFESGKNAEQDVTNGLKMLDEGGRKDAYTLAARGQLLLVRAGAARSKPERAEAARLAQDAFERAFKKNPLLEREFGNELRTAKTLL
jgi:serine/threonine-protein kinase